MDRTEIIRRRIADLRSEKYAYLAEYLVEGNDLYVDTDTFVADEWGDLLNFLENRVLPEGLKYDVAKEQEYMDFGKIYVGDSLREYINNIPDPEEGDNTVNQLTDYLNFKLKTKFDYDLQPANRLCFVHDDPLRPALPVIAKCIRDQGEEGLLRSALIVLDFERILSCIEDQDSDAEYRIYNTLKYRLEKLAYYGYDRIYLHNVGPLRVMFEGENIYDNLRIPYLCLGVRIVMSGRLSYFVQYVIQQNDRCDEDRYGDFIVPRQLSKYRRLLRPEDLPKLTQEEAQRVEDVVLFTAREVFYTDELLASMSCEDPWWNNLSKYESRLKVNTDWRRTWKFPEWMPRLIEFYIFDALLQSCDTQEDRERVERFKVEALKCLPEPFQDKSFTEAPYEDPVYELVLSTGIVDSMWNADTKSDISRVPDPEVAAYYLNLEKYRRPKAETGGAAGSGQFC